MQGVPYIQNRAGIGDGEHEKIHSGRCAKWRADAVEKRRDRNGRWTHGTSHL